MDFERNLKKAQGNLQRLHGSLVHAPLQLWVEEVDHDEVLGTFQKKMDQGWKSPNSRWIEQKRILLPFPEW